MFSITKNRLFNLMLEEKQIMIPKLRKFILLFPKTAWKNINLSRNGCHLKLSDFLWDTRYLLLGTLVEVQFVHITALSPHVFISRNPTIIIMQFYLTTQACNVLILFPLQYRKWSIIKKLSMVVVYSEEEIKPFIRYCLSYYSFKHVLA